MKSRRKPSTSKTKSLGFVASYVHYRTGKVMRAKDYGYKGWPFGGGR